MKTSVQFLAALLANLSFRQDTFKKNDSIIKDNHQDMLNNIYGTILK